MAGQSALNAARLVDGGRGLRSRAAAYRAPLFSLRIAAVTALPLPVADADLTPLNTFGLPARARRLLVLTSADHFVRWRGPARVGARARLVLGGALEPDLPPAAFAGAGAEGGKSAAAG